MKYIFFALLLLYSTIIPAQKYDAYKEDYIGWIKIYKYKGATKPVQVENKKYSIAQLSIIDSFANWMQASYTPKGSLGDIIKYVSPKTGIYNENKYNVAVPHSFGARAVSYLYLKKSGTGWTPENNLAYGWTICANEIPLSYRHQDFETGKICLFTLPALREEEDQDEQALYGLSKYPAINKYIHHVSPKYASTLRINHVILSKNNVNPFVQLTIGEALQYAEDALPVKLAEELKNIRANNIGRQAEIERLSGYQEQNFARCRETLAQMKEKYKNRLNEPAYTWGGILSDLQNGYDFFTKAKVNEQGRIDKTTPLLRVRPEMEALCKTDKPQWIMIKWYGGAMNDLPFKHMHESIINNLDFDYVYNFFFEQEKLKGVAYKPKRSPTFEEKLVESEKSDAAKKNETDVSVFLFEDFSSTPEGKMPQGWNANLNSMGQKPIVKKEAGLNWINLNGQIFHINKIKEKFPENFTASFDVFVRKGFHWGSPGLEFHLAGNEKYKGSSYENSIIIKLRPGFDERDGWATVTIKTPTKTAFPSEVAVPGFSNTKSINRTKVTVRKKGESLQVFVGETKVFDEKSVLPANLLLNHLFFKEDNQGWEVEDFYVTNIKIIKE